MKIIQETAYNTFSSLTNLSTTSHPIVNLQYKQNWHNNERWNESLNEFWQLAEATNKRIGTSFSVILLYKHYW